MFAVYPQEVFNNSNQKNTALYLRISKFIKGIVFFSNMGTYYTSLYPPHVMKGLGAPPKGFFCFSFLWNMWSMSLMFRFQFKCSYLLFSFPASFLNASSHFQGWDILVPGGQSSERSGQPCRKMCPRSRPPFPAGHAAPHPRCHTSHHTPWCHTLLKHTSPSHHMDSNTKRI